MSIDTFTTVFTEAQHVCRAVWFSGSRVGTANTEGMYFETADTAQMISPGTRDFVKIIWEMPLSRSSASRVIAGTFTPGATDPDWWIRMETPNNRWQYIVHIGDSGGSHVAQLSAGVTEAGHDQIHADACYLIVRRVSLPTPKIELGYINPVTREIVWAEATRASPAPTTVPASFDYDDMLSNPTVYQCWGGGRSGAGLVTQVYGFSAFKGFCWIMAADGRSFRDSGVAGANEILVDDAKVLNWAENHYAAILREEADGDVIVDGVGALYRNGEEIRPQAYGDFVPTSGDELRSIRSGKRFAVQLSGSGLAQRGYGPVYSAPSYYGESYTQNSIVGTVLRDLDAGEGSAVPFVRNMRHDPTYTEQDIGTFRGNVQMVSSIDPATGLPQRFGMPNAGGAVLIDSSAADAHVFRHNMTWIGPDEFHKGSTNAIAGSGASKAIHSRKFSHHEVVTFSASETDGSYPLDSGDELLAVTTISRIDDDGITTEIMSGGGDLDAWASGDPINTSNSVDDPGTQRMTSYGTSCRLANGMTVAAERRWDRNSGCNVLEWRSADGATRTYTAPWKDSVTPYSQEFYTSVDPGTGVSSNFDVRNQAPDVGYIGEVYDGVVAYFANAATSAFGQTAANYNHCLGVLIEYGDGAPATLQNNANWRAWDGQPLDGSGPDSLTRGVSAPMRHAFVASKLQKDVGPWRSVDGATGTPQERYDRYRLIPVMFPRPIFRKPYMFMAYAASDFRLSTSQDFQYDGVRGRRLFMEIHRYNPTTKGMDFLSVVDITDRFMAEIDSDVAVRDTITAIAYAVEESLETPEFWVSFSLDGSSPPSRGVTSPGILGTTGKAYVQQLASAHWINAASQAETFYLHPDRYYDVADASALNTGGGSVIHQAPPDTSAMIQSGGRYSVPVDFLRGASDGSDARIFPTGAGTNQEFAAIGTKLADVSAVVAAGRAQMSAGGWREREFRSRSFLRG